VNCSFFPGTQLYDCLDYVMLLNVPFNMTPTRTDTTLQQRRRAFNQISLNNTHHHVHSSDTTRPKVGFGTCSTSPTRVNNEQGSTNNMCGDPTREQLTNWVMSKDSVASCFIKDVLSMPESEHAGGTHSPAQLFLAHPNSASDRCFLLLSRSRALQIRFPGCHRSGRCSVRTSYCLHT
jgi:hypothetical protein